MIQLNRKFLKKASLRTLVVANLILHGCTSTPKQKLEFNTNSTYDISTLLNAENCNIECGKIAQCENQTVQVKGRIDEDNVNDFVNQFYLFDLRDDSYRLEVKVKDEDKDSTFSEIKKLMKSPITISGVLKGVDAPTNYTCEKLYTLHLVRD